MNFELQPLFKLFNGRIYRIPDYQRGYAWTKRQINDFWSDLMNLENNKNHYVGVLYLDGVKKDKYTKDKAWSDDIWIIEGKSFKPFYIVDGQQRLTTSIVLIQAILNVVENKFQPTKKLAYTSLDKIREQYIFEQKDEGIERTYIFGYEKDNPSYEYLKKSIFKEESSSGYHSEKTLYTQNLTNALNFFEQEVNKLDFESIESIYKKLTQHFLFNIFTITEDINIYSAFETINNRGKRLSLLELLKNRLIGITVKLETTESEKEVIRRRIHDAWRAIYYFLGKEKDGRINDEVFLCAHTLSYFRELLESDNYDNGNPPLKILRQYLRYVNGSYESLRITNDAIENILLEEVFNNQSNKQNISLRDIDNYIKDIQQSVEFWYDIHYPSDEKFSKEEIIWLDKIRRLGNESAYLHIFRFENKQHKSHKSTSTKTFTSFLKDLELRYVSDLFIRIRYDNFYKWKGCKYLLFEYDLYLREKDKTNSGKKRTNFKQLDWEDINFTPFYDNDYESDFDYKTIEHILPQTWQNSDYWRERFGQFRENDVEKLIHSIGNLLPMSHSRNSGISNNDYPKKTESYKKGSFTEVELIEKYKEWDFKAIIDRNVEIFEFIKLRWPSSRFEELNSKEEILRFLGLDKIKPQIRMKPIKPIR